MLKKLLLSAAVLALAVAGEAKAGTISAFYSLDGGALTALADLDPTASGFAFSGAIGTFTLNILGGAVEPDAAGALLSVTAIDTHSGATQNNLKVYFVSTGFATSGSQTFTSQFTSNAAGSGLNVIGSTFLGNPP